MLSIPTFLLTQIKSTIGLPLFINIKLVGDFLAVFTALIS